jgi:7,8-dihydroneopterin aldolase/epimerase/oxygenase
MTGSIALEGLEFHAFHGVYPHERESGNYFEVDIAVETDFTVGALHDDLSGTVNYESLFSIVKSEMDRPSHLLETVAAQIIQKTFSELPAVMSVSVKISKLNPPIGVKCKKSSVSISRQRN